MVGQYNDNQVAFAEACYGIAEIAAVMQDELNIIQETIFKVDEGDKG